MILAATVIMACVPRVDRIPASYTFDGSDTGIVIGRVEIVNSDGEPISGDYERALIVKRQSEGPFANGYAIVLAEPVSDVYAALPPGDYLWLTRGCYDRLTFAVSPGVVTYLGTLRLTSRPPLPCPGVEVHDDYAAGVERFRSSYPDLGGKIEKQLMLRWECGLYGECRPVWRSD